MVDLMIDLFFDLITNLMVNLIVDLLIDLMVKLIVNLTLNYKMSGLENNNREERVINFSESQMIKRDQNNYEQTNYENILIRNMSELLINRVILQLVRG